MFFHFYQVNWMIPETIQIHLTIFQRIQLFSAFNYLF